MQKEQLRGYEYHGFCQYYQTPIARLVLVNRTETYLPYDWHEKGFNRCGREQTGLDLPCFGCEHHTWKEDLNREEVLQRWVPDT
ncbi:MAG: hypothetical protein ACE5JP_10905 [Candidatus Bipolaricaulia bacterium]